MKKSLLAQASTHGLGASNPHTKKPKEPTIALINIVFLLLIFFLAASTLAPPMDEHVQLIDTQLLDNDPPPSALVIRADGSLFLQGERITVDSYLSTITAQQDDDNRPSVRLVPDKNVAAKTLIKIANQLQQGGIPSIKLVTLRDLQHDQ